MTDMVEFIEPPKPPVLVNSWPVGLSLETAIDELVVGEKIMTEEDIASQFDLTVERLRQIKQHPAFRAEVRGHMATIKEDGATIKRKAKLALEFYLDSEVPKWIADDKASVDAKTKLLQFLAKLSGMEAAEKAAMDAKTQGQVQQAPSINITLTTAAPIQSMQVPTLERVVN